MLRSTLICEAFDRQSPSDIRDKRHKANKDRSGATQPPGLRTDHLEEGERTSKEGTETG